MLSYDWSVNRAGVRHLHITCNQFGKHKLMYSRCGRMDPTQPTGSLELLWPKLPADQYFRIDDFINEAVKIF